jgi:MarR family transcriptional regulator, organic hydroperoxide resistance regulator
MEKSDLIKDIIELHHKLNQILRQVGSDAWMGLSLTVPQVKSLFFIYDQGNTNFRKLACALKVTPSNLTGVIDRLVEQGLVSRTENPEDRRMMQLKATGKGEELVSELREKRTSLLSHSLNNLMSKELETIHKGLVLINGAVEAQSSELESQPCADPSFEREPVH